MDKKLLLVLPSIYYIIICSFLTVYYDARLLSPNIEAVHLFTFDQKTPAQSPKEADFPAPIYGSYGRVVDDNIDNAAR